MTMQRIQSLLTSLGLVLILLGALRGTEVTAGVFTFAALLILAVTTYPPADARRGAQAALVLASAIGLFVLGSLLDEMRAGQLQALNDLVVLVGATMVAVDAAGQLLDDAEQSQAGNQWSGGPGRPRRAPPQAEGTVTPAGGQGTVSSA